MEIKDYKHFNYAGKRVLLRADINSPLNPESRTISDLTRIKKSMPTLQYLLEQGAQVAVIAHQGDTLDYQNLIPMQEHAEKMSELLGKPVTYIDDVCGPEAIRRIGNLQAGEAILLGNLRYLTEEVSSFEAAVPLKAEEMTQTWLIRKLAPLFDYYVNDAFSAAHRGCPSMIGFQQVLPSAAGELFFKEYSVLSQLLANPRKPCVFVLGGAKISDAFGMIEQVLNKRTADKILVGGVTGVVFLLAAGHRIGKTYETWLEERDLLSFVKPAKQYLSQYADQIMIPVDLAYARSNSRAECAINELPIDDASFLDIGKHTIKQYLEVIRQAATLFVNGPVGAYEHALFEEGTRQIMQGIANADGYSIVGGGDTVQSAQKFAGHQAFDYVCTAGGAMMRFMTGQKLPLIEAMEKSMFEE